MTAQDFMDAFCDDDLVEWYSPQDDEWYRCYNEFEVRKKFDKGFKLRVTRYIEPKL